jgi:NADPH:quinone reductase-like Zn-dependent oxidoreductase
MMKAAVVRSFDKPPRFEEFAPPTAAAGEVLVTMRAAALSQLVRAVASGRHYSGDGQLPMIPGIDGVGVGPDGRRVYVAFPSGVHGTMAEQTAVPAAYTTPVPDGVGDAAAAAIANPGMSSWAALVERAHLLPGETVLVNGATGTSGRLAVQVAKHLGAKRVVATGRNRAVLDQLPTIGADAVVGLDQPPEDLTAAFHQHVADGVDVVLDYLWGPPAEQLIAAFAGHGAAAGAVRADRVDGRCDRQPIGRSASQLGAGADGQRHRQRLPGGAGPVDRRRAGGAGRGPDLYRVRPGAPGGRGGRVAGAVGRPRGVHYVSDGDDGRPAAWASRGRR